MAGSVQLVMAPGRDESEKQVNRPEQMGRGSLAFARRIVGMVGAPVGVSLLVTGSYLLVGYRPTVAAGNPVGASTVYTADWMRFAHRWSARALLLVIHVWVVLSVAQVVSRSARPAEIALSVGGLVVGAMTWVSGFFLPWDQVAAWSVAAGQNLDGYRMLFDERTRFVVVGGTQVDLSQLRLILGLHAVVLPVGLVVLAGAAIGVHRRRRSAEHP